MWVSKDEFLHSIEETERKHYLETIAFLDDKTRRDGRTLARAADYIDFVLSESRSHDELYDAFEALLKEFREHFATETQIIKERGERIRNQGNA